MSGKEVRELKILISENEYWLLTEIKEAAEVICDKSTHSDILESLHTLLSLSIVEAFDKFEGKLSISVSIDPSMSVQSLPLFDKILELPQNYEFEKLICLLKIYKNVYYRLFNSHLNAELFRFFLEQFFDNLEIYLIKQRSSVSGNGNYSESDSDKEILNYERNKYLTIFQRLFIPVILLDKENNVLNYNEAASGLFSQLQINKPLDSNESLKDPDLFLVIEQLKELDSTNKGRKEFEAYLNTTSGQRFFQVIIKVLSSDKNLFEGKLIMLDDLTNRKEVEEHLEVAKTNAEEADKLKTAFLANMSHEIRTPMNAILGFTELLLTGQIGGSERNEYLKLIQKSGNDLLHIIDDIIDISKIETKQLKIKDKPCKPYDLLTDLYKMYKEILTKRVNNDVDIVLNVEENEKDITLMTDIERLKQVLSNLINNALKFTDEGFIEFGYKLAENSRIYFYVKDTGIGIPEKMQEKIFERFTQIDDTYSKNPGGTGLGLTICKNIVKLLGGDIWVMSSLGEGSNFYFYLPVKYSEQMYEEKTRTKNIFNDHIHYNWKDCKLLIAEDEATNYLYLKEILKRTGINILWAKTGLDAINLTESVEDINLILMDIKMPELNGLEAAKYILKIRPDIPIIAQTAFAMDDDRELCIRIGFKEYLSKPINKGKLLQVLNKYLRKQDQHKIPVSRS